MKIKDKLDALVEERIDYVKDIEDLNTKQFKILINVFKKFK